MYQRIKKKIAMRQTAKRTVLSTLLSVCMLLVHAQTIALSDGWQCKSSAEEKWYDTKVPTTVMGALVNNGEYPDLLVSDNYEKADNSRFLVPWLFKNAFRLDGLGRDEHVRLLFEGLDYSANIYLNDQLVASRDTVKGPFRTFAIDVTGIAKEENTLVVETFKCEPGDFNLGFVDWNPRPLDESMGIVRPVKVQRSGAVVIESPRVCTQVNLNTLQEAWVKVEAQLHNLSSHPVEGRLICTFEGEKAAIPVTLKAGQTQTVRLDDQDLQALYVANPRLWWCYTMGSPELYALSLTFEADGKVSDTADVRFGIREVGSFITNDGYRAFTLNGKRILLLGAGWTDDIFLRDDAASYDRQLELVKQMNLNTVRLEGFWGTSQALYDLCDEKGILLLAGWSCFWEWDDYLGKHCDDRYGGILTDEDAALIAHSYDDQLRYLRNHPSIIAWFVGSDKLPIPQLESHYEWVRKNLDDRPYIISAKQMESDLSGTSGTKMAGPYEYVGPAYWYAKEAPGGAFGFNTETGIGAQLPVKESLRQMIGDKLWPIDQVWDYHCTFSSSAFNNLNVLKETVTKRYGEASGLDDFLRKANMVNYDGTRAMFEAFRYNSPKATALVQWMLNGARPSLYWQLYDYYLRPNASFYSVKKACQPVQLIYNYLTHEVKAVNSTLQPIRIKAMLSVYGVSGQLLDSQETDVEIPALSNAPAFGPVSFSEPNGYLFLSCLQDGQVIAENEYALTTDADSFDWAKSDWTGTPMLKHADLSAIGNQTPAKCKIATQLISGREADLSITNPTDRVAYLLRVVLKDKKGQIIDGVTFSDNYLTIAPGATKTIHCNLPRETKFTADVLPY